MDGEFTDDKNNSKRAKSRRLVVKIDRCSQDHHCQSLRACPVGAITQKELSAPDIDTAKCIRCGKCVFCCPMMVFKLE